MLDHTAPILTAATGHGSRTESLAVRVFDTLFDWMDRYRARRALYGMSDALLHDIGLARADIDQEASKPFWRQ